MPSIPDGLLLLVHPAGCKECDRARTIFESWKKRFNKLFAEGELEVRLKSAVGTIPAGSKLPEGLAGILENPPVFFLDREYKGDLNAMIWYDKRQDNMLEVQLGLRRRTKKED